MKASISHPIKRELIPVLAWLKTKRVAVLKGGWSRERSISLKTGQAVEDSLCRLGVRFTSVDVQPSIDRELVAKKINFAFLALHGTFGEDGGIQSLLDTLKISYTGSGALSSALAMDKDLSKKIFVKAGVPTPSWHTLSKNDFKRDPRGAVQNILKTFGKKILFVKPADQGSAIGVTRVDHPNNLKKALTGCFRLADRAMIETFVSGREFTVGIIGNKALPVVEIVPVHSFYDFHSKYAKGGSRHLVPASLSTVLTKQAQAISLKAFRSLQCRAVGRVDLLLNRQGRFYVLEVNTIPGMTATSLLPDAARAAGFTFDDLVLKIVDLSRRRTNF